MAAFLEGNLSSVNSGILTTVADERTRRAKDISLVNPWKSLAVALTDLQTRVRKGQLDYAQAITHRKPKSDTRSLTSDASCIWSL